jgi:hypothetical protein
MALAPDELRNVLARAEEIQSASSISTIELEAVIQAAEEVGIARSAIERALRERLHLPLRVPEVGELTFAKSADGKFYVAEIIGVKDDVFSVRFLRGGTHHVSGDELRPCSFLPGEQVVCYWPWWGPWTCTVLNYDQAQGVVKVTDGWGDSKTFPISEVWIAPRKKIVTARNRVYAALIGIGIAAGAAIGVIVTGLLLP